MSLADKVLQRENRIAAQEKEIDPKVRDLSTKDKEIVKLKKEYDAILADMQDGQKPATKKRLAKYDKLKGELDSIQPTLQKLLDSNVLNSSFANPLQKLIELASEASSEHAVNPKGDSSNRP